MQDGEMKRWKKERVRRRNREPAQLLSRKPTAEPKPPKREETGGKIDY